MSRARGGRQGSGRQGGGFGGGAAPDLERVVKAALAASAVVFVAQIIWDVVDHVLTGRGDLPLESILKTEIVAIVGTFALIGAVVAVVVGGASERMIGWGVAAVYLGEIAQRIVRTIVYDGSPDGLNVVVNPVYTVITFVGFVIAYRVLTGQTLLPWVNTRI